MHLFEKHDAEYSNRNPKHLRTFHRRRLLKLVQFAIPINVNSFTAAVAFAVVVVVVGRTYFQSENTRSWALSYLSKTSGTSSSDWGWAPPFTYCSSRGVPLFYYDDEGSENVAFKTSPPPSKLCSAAEIRPGKKPRRVFSLPVVCFSNHRIVCSFFVSGPALDRSFHLYTYLFFLSTIFLRL